MKYKGSYAPSELLCVDKYSWYDLEKCQPLLDKKKFAVFSKELNDANGTPEDNYDEVVKSIQFLVGSKVVNYDQINPKVLVKLKETLEIYISMQ